MNKLRGLLAKWKRRAGLLRRDLLALYLAYRDPRVPWYAKAFMAAIIGYAISPIDLVPDFIPVLGYLDDLIIVPGGIYLAIKMIPKEVMAECREKVRSSQISSRSKWTMAGIISLIWILLAALVAIIIWRVK
jgi:uncharacterized membrane protein YkvA (DUF1232 family)